MANEFHSEAININSSDISESVAEAMYSDAGLMAEEFHSEAMSQIDNIQSSGIFKKLLNTKSHGLFK